MELIDAYRTSDGTVFTDHAKAVRHLDEKVGVIVTRHAIKLAQLHKYGETIDYLLSVLPELAAAHHWQAEMKEALDGSSNRL